MKKSWVLFSICPLFLFTTLTASAAEGKLHVPSPDWREQIIYFVMIDRFNDGNPANNDQGVGEYDPKQNSKYSGGDLQGIENKISYIKELGATTVWVTPPVANQWWMKNKQYSGYHGYWAENLMAVDKHYGSLADYQNLSRALHGQGMYLIQDIVVNHMGDFFSYDKTWDLRKPSLGFRYEPKSGQGHAPSQFPFNLNDARKPEQAKQAVYHWTPDITNYADPVQEHTYQMAGLDDLNTENPVVRDALRQSYGYWIKEAGVDGFRVDTAFYVPPDYFRDFLYSEDATHPGMMAVAKQTGRDQFHVFGEGFAIDKPFEDKQSLKIEGYKRNTQGQALMPGMLNFPLYGTSQDVFASGHATAELSYRIQTMLRVHDQPQLMASFVDNHDVDRYLSNGNVSGLKQSLLLMMTLPGIPVIYYGTEQGLLDQRGAMFKTGFGAMGRDRFNEQSELFQYIKSISQLRKGNKVFTHGTPSIVKDNAAGAGVLAYWMQNGQDKVLVIFNSAEHEALLDNLDTGLPEGTLLEPMFSIQDNPGQIRVGANSRVSMALPARAGIVLQARGKHIDGVTGLGKLSINPLSSKTFNEDFIVSGLSVPNSALQLVVDGDLSRALKVSADGKGRWQAKIDTGPMMDPSISHQVVAWQPETAISSNAVSFNIERQWQPVLTLDDAKGDDHGLSGLVQYPNDPSWRENHPLDIERISVFKSGNNLKIELQMASLIKQWNPPNGFDHIIFTGFLQMPGQSGGSAVMPMQNATLPDGMRWQYRWRVNGWANALFSADNADAGHEGSSISPTAKVSVDSANKTIRFIIPGKSIGNPGSLSGTKLYINTWDYDGGYRELNQQAGTMVFGGGKPDEPKILDATVVITLP